MNSKNNRNSSKEYLARWRDTRPNQRNLERENARQRYLLSTTADKNSVSLRELLSNPEANEKVTDEIEKRRSKLWRYINQYISAPNNTENEDLIYLFKLYEEDIVNFSTGVSSWSESKMVCAVCGVHPEACCTLLEKENHLLSVLMQKNENNATLRMDKDNLILYRKHMENPSRIPTCETCLSHLKAKKVPKLSRFNINIPDRILILSKLNLLEQLLVSPILPMLCLWRYRRFGQYASKGQCVAFINKIQKIASVLPRTLEDVVLNFKNIHSNNDFDISVSKLRNTLLFLKKENPVYKNIDISEKNFEELEKQCTKNTNFTSEETCMNEIDKIDIIHNTEQFLRDVGQNQIVDEEIAARSLCSTLSIEKEDISNLKSSVTNIFQSITRREAQLFTSKNSKDGWELLFPTILWNTKGGPNDTSTTSISLRDWLDYVIKIEELGFKNNALFICYSNSYLRKQRISGIVSNRPITKPVESAIEEMIKICKDGNQETIPESALQSLIKRVSLYNINLPGSLSDMRDFRGDIISMMKKHGPPSIFLTLSSAESFSFETFIEIFSGKITRDEFNMLTSKQKADIIADNPVKVTVAWKRRMKMFLRFVLDGKSKPLGNIKHYVQKTEWQGRLSEHAHFLFWVEPKPPSINLDENGIPSGNQCGIIEKAESLGTCIIPNEGDDKTSDNQDNIKLQLSKPPLLLHDYLSSNEKKNEISDLMRICNIHKCGAYCTSNSKRK